MSAHPPPWAPGYGHRTADVAPVPALFRQELEDFQVEELPLRPPSGAGEHVLCAIEKRGIATDEAVRRLARALGTRPTEIGWAGRKDARGVTRQSLSVRGVDPERVRAVSVPGVRVLAAEAHDRKLRPGHLRGNRFHLRLREVAREHRPRVDAVLGRLTSEGLANWYGPQRFGQSGRSFELGRLLARRRWREYLLALATPAHVPDHAALADVRAWLRGEGVPTRSQCDQLGRTLGPAWRRLLRDVRSGAEPRELARAVPRPLRALHVAAFQAFLFNRVLGARLDDIDRPLRGDVAWIHASGACFLVEDAAEAERRSGGPEFELSPSGPVWGPRTLVATDQPGVAERAVLAEEELEPADFGRIGLGLNVRGARRPLRVPVGELSWELRESCLRLTFSLPPGSYATALVEELCKRFG